MRKSKALAGAFAVASKREDPCDPRPREGYLEWDDYFMALAFLSAQRSKDPNKQVGAVIVGANKVVLGIGYNGFPRGCHDSALPWSKEPQPLPFPGPDSLAQAASSRSFPPGDAGASQYGAPRAHDAGPGTPAASPPPPPPSQQGRQQQHRGPQGQHALPPGSSDASALLDPVLETKYPYVVHAEANALLNKNAASLDGASIYVTMFPCNECAKLLIQAGIRQVIYHEGKVQDKVGGDPELTRRRAAGSTATAANTATAGHSADLPAAVLPRHPNKPQRRAPDPMDACYVASHRMLALAGVSTRQHRLRRTVVICGEDGLGWEDVDGPA